MWMTSPLKTETWKKLISFFFKVKVENVRGWFQHEEMVIQFKGAD